MMTLTPANDTPSGASVTPINEPVGLGGTGAAVAALGATPAAV